MQHLTLLDANLPTTAKGRRLAPGRPAEFRDIERGTAAEGRDQIHLRYSSAHRGSCEVGFVQWVSLLETVWDFFAVVLGNGSIHYLAHICNLKNRLKKKQVEVEQQWIKRNTYLTSFHSALLCMRFGTQMLGIIWLLNNKRFGCKLTPCCSWD